MTRDGRAGEEADPAVALERSRDLDRFLTFLDAVVAIAITLLVLPLVDLAGEVGEHDDVGDLLAEHQAEVWAFLLSFTVIARLWFGQHRAMRNVLSYDTRVAGLLMAWGLTIAFLPFPTALVAEVADSGLTKVLYIGTMIVSMALIAAVAMVVARHPELTDGHGVPDPAGAAANVLLLLAALGITLAVPATSYVPLLLLVLGDRLTVGWHRLRGRGRRPGTAT